MVNDNPSSPASFETQYGWSGGELASVTYASGFKVFYNRDATGRITGIDTRAPGLGSSTNPFVTSLAHTALGQPRSWNWASGDSASRTFDGDGRMTASEFSAYSYDAAGRITGVTQSLLATSTATGTVTVFPTTLTWTAGYDNRNRLTSFNRAGSSAAYTYDANSNRLTMVSTSTRDADLDGDLDAADYSRSTSQGSLIGAGTNQLLGFTQTLTRVQGSSTLSTVVSTVSYSLDSAGNMTGDGLRTFDYDNANRLAKARIFKDGEAMSVSYLHNALGQRVFKGEAQADQYLPDETELGQSFIDWLRQRFRWMFESQQASTSIGTAFMYADGVAEGGLPEWAVLGSYDNGSASGTGRSEYIWLPVEGGSAIPVGLFRNGNLYAIHADHLGTPRLMTNGANQVVWQWPYSGFGGNRPTGVLQVTTNPYHATMIDPEMLKSTPPAVSLDLRFPGQMVDGETGTYYNYFRQYDSKTGRYTQSDPIGLRGGINMYAYVEGNPLVQADPSGLQVAVPTPLGPVPLPVPTFPTTNSPRPIDPTELGGPTVIPGLSLPSLRLPPFPGLALAQLMNSVVNQGCSPNEDFWKGLRPYRGKTKTNGESGRRRRLYEWDFTHGDVEEYDSRGNHLGSVDPATGNQTKPAVPGRRIDL